MECDVCGRKLRIFNQHGLTVACDSCPHWSFHGDIYPSLFSERDQKFLEAEEKAGLCRLENREQGGYYYWSMTPQHPQYQEALKKFEELAEELVEG